MGVVCYLCQIQFEKVEELMKHLSSIKIHNLNQYSDYKCAQPSCFREYAGSRSFVRHIRKDHANDLTKPWVPKRLRNDQCDTFSIQHPTVRSKNADESSSHER